MHRTRVLNYRVKPTVEWILADLRGQNWPDGAVERGKVALPALREQEAVLIAKDKVPPKVGASTAQGNKEPADDKELVHMQCPVQFHRQELFQYTRQVGLN